MEKPVLGIALLAASLLGACDQVSAVSDAPQRVNALEKQVKGLEAQVAQLRTAAPKAQQVEAGQASCTGAGAAPVAVKFKKPFAQAPAVVLGLSGFEAPLPKGRSASLSVSAAAKDIKPDGFTVAVDAGSNKGVGCTVSWVALEALPSS
jgi:hypothetical protein